MKFIYMALAFVFTTVAYAQLPKAVKGTYALTNAQVVTITNGTVENGTVVISDGKITAVGASVAIPADAETIDCSGMSIYPGFIDGGTQLGLTEVGSDPRTRDYNEVGEINPHIQALTAVNPSAVNIAVTRVNGITTSLALPTGGLFSGTAALFNLHGYNPDQMYAGFKGVVCNFPATGRRSRWDRRSDEDIKKDAEKALKTLNDTWAKAVQYFKIDSMGSQQDYYPEMEALLPVVKKEIKLLINVDAAADIKAAIEWVEKNDVDAVLCGVAEGWRVADKIAEAELPVITGPVINLPSRNYDKYDRAYANAGLMHKAGVKVAIRGSSGSGIERNLPFQAGFAATYGLGQEEALKAITINAAEIFGVADKYGSIEVGKSANLFVADGDPFETKTTVKYLFIEGWNIPTVNRQTQLYDEYLERTPSVNK